ncbi:hypothetical protein [Pseudofulvibacter geojedonensis]|uniref:Uncharacterized protein n=1 Tax=Pseudofulvibacter geojedonensis TaxID=1123758 RepID=A0ABW3I091_9FLAO
MKKVFILFIAFASLTCLSQDNLILKKEGKTLQNIIPKGWKILDSKKGDLNKDGILDLVFAIQNTDKKNIESNDGLGADTIDLNPRILGIYFGSKSGGFTQKLVSNHFIILQDIPTMDEPFDGFSISKKGVLDIKFKFWFSAGSWTMSNNTYRFCYQNNEFALIGYDSSETHRGTGETTDYSINFLTKKMKIVKGSFSNEVSETVDWKEISLERLITLKDIDKPFELDFEGIRL